jgi:hypothetical protein
MQQASLARLTNEILDGPGHRAILERIGNTSQPEFSSEQVVNRDPTFSSVSLFPPSLYSSFRTTPYETAYCRSGLLIYVMFCRK